MKQNNTKHKKLLQENADPSKVIDAIKKRYEVEINYASDDPKAIGRRIIQPVAYGLSKAGRPVLRAFQPIGDTKTKTPHWKLFRLDKITKWKAYRGRKFETPPPLQYPSEGEYNSNGDKSMKEVYICADFKGSKERYERGGLKKHNEKVRAEKIAQNPYYPLKKNIENSYTATNDIMKRIQATAIKDRFKRKDIQNAYEMMQANNFGDDEYTDTVGPITKTNTGTATKQNVSHNMNYLNVADNGPVTKTLSTQQDKTETVDNEIEINNQENNKEKENNEQNG